MVGGNKKFPKRVDLHVTDLHGGLFLREGTCQSARLPKLCDNFIGSQ